MDCVREHVGPLEMYTTGAAAASPASSPGPFRSGSGTPSKLSGFFDSLRRPRPESPGSSLGGDMTTAAQLSPTVAHRVGLPSFTSGLAKRERIRRLEEELSLSRSTQARQAAALTAEAAARVEAQERLNMQYLKSSLVVDMLVAKLLKLDDVPLLSPAVGVCGERANAPQLGQPRRMNV